jgi:group I intron endonuclease
MVIYKIENKKNGKCYIGQTTQKFEKRMSEHKHRALFQPERSHKLYMALRKHGIDSFNYDVLCECGNRDDLDKMEVEYISQFNSFNRGYNMTVGGDSVSDDTREKLRSIFLGRKVPWAHKIVAARKANGTSSFPNVKGSNSVMAKTYIVTTPEGEVITVKGIRAWCRENGLSHSGMINCANGIISKHHGHLCRYADNNVQRPAERRTPKQVEMGIILRDGDMVCSAMKVAAVA